MDKMVVMGMKAVTAKNLDYLVWAAHSPQVRLGKDSYLLRTCFGQATDIEQVLYSC
ncbi:hypothetical protein [Sphingobacterium siyangense]